MTDRVASYLAQQNLERALERVELKGKLDPQLNAAPVLCRTKQGLLLVAANSASEGRYIDVLAQPGLRYLEGRLNDSLEVAGATFKIPTGKADDAQRLLRHSRLSALAEASEATERRGAPPPSSELIQELNEHSWLALCSLLAPEELLIAYIPTETKLAVCSPLADDLEADAYFVATTERAFLLAVSKLGDVKTEIVEAGRFEVLKQGRARLVRAQNTEWNIGQEYLARYEAIEGAMTKQGDARLLQAARAEWLLAQGANPSTQGAQRLLEPLLSQAAETATTEALSASIAEALLKFSEHQSPSLAQLTALLVKHPEANDLPAKIWTSFRFDVATGHRLIRAIAEPEARNADWSLNLHKELHRASQAAAAELPNAAEQRALNDTCLAEHLISAGHAREARRLLERSLEQLPSELLDDILPDPAADLTQGAGGQQVHIKLYELLSRAKNDQQKADAVVELARLQPLVPSRLKHLTEVANQSLAKRAASALACLEPGGLTPNLEEPPEDIITLPSHLIEGILPHPLARSGSALLRRLQALVAQVEVPNVGVLRDYCELISSNDTGASRALAAAATALGMQQVEGYISRGKKSVGTRAYEGKPPFVLLGGRHLEENPAFKLTPLELRFALGAEVAHLRFEHTRITSSELWAGALDAGKQSLDLALGVLPLFRGVQLAGRIGKIARAIKLSDVQQVLATTRMLRSSTKSKKAAQSSSADIEVITAPNEELITAHRLMQLTADRAGLLLSGDIRSAIRSMFLVRSDFRAELLSVEQKGLSEVLGRRREDGSMAYQNLAVRISALFNFYLSEEYPLLRGAMTGKAAS